MMIEITVVIPTYRRPDDLARAIAAVQAQRGVGVQFEVLVVDNDPAGSAAPIAEGAAAESSMPIRYVGEPRPGISHARNTGVVCAEGRYLAFLDDDEVVASDWLAALLDTVKRFSADAVVGPVLPRFPEGIEIDAYRRRVYTRDARLPTGSRLLRWNIGNSLFAKARCFVDAEPFLPRLGRTGGEDTVFLRQMTHRGCTMVWCAEAIAWESVPPERLEPRYLLRRAFRGAQTTTYVCTMVEPRELGRALRFMVTGCIQVMLYGPLALALKALKHRRWLPTMAMAVGGLGKLLWHPSWHLRMYQ